MTLKPCKSRRLTARPAVSRRAPGAVFTALSLTSTVPEACIEACISDAHPPNPLAPRKQCNSDAKTYEVNWREVPIKRGSECADDGIRQIGSEHGQRSP